MTEPYSSDQDPLTAILYGQGVSLDWDFRRFQFCAWVGSPGEFTYLASEGFGVRSFSVPSDAFFNRAPYIRLDEVLKFIPLKSAGLTTR